jgi:serine/threonine protein kinase
MEVEVWDGGLQRQEITAIEKIKEAFSPQTKRRGDYRQQLMNTKMYPWKGYAGFRFVDSKNHDGEFDLIIVTHCNVIIVELKDWNHQPITAKGETWYKGNQNMKRSPVSVTRVKQHTLERRLKAVKHRFTNKDYAPHVKFFVVMTGDSDFSQLPESELLHTISLDDFLKFSNQQVFNEFFRPHPDAQVLNQDFHIFDELFLGPQTGPKPLVIDGYEAVVPPIFDNHPLGLYKEYVAKSGNTANPEALMRVWDFSKLGDSRSYTPEGRGEIVGRERAVLQHINHLNRDLYNHCFHSLTSFQPEDVTTEYCEVYELPPGHVKFNEFIGKYAVNFDLKQREKLAKLIVAKFAELHRIKIAHRDLSQHFLWISPSKEIALSNFISAYHQPVGTVGDIRQNVSVGYLRLENEGTENFETPYQVDVHSLAILLWHLLDGKRVSPRSLRDTKRDMEVSSSWYAQLLIEAISGRYKNAEEFFESFMAAEPSKEPIPTFDVAELDPFIQEINHSRQYREDDDFIVESATKEVYVSDGRLVKAWLNVSPDNPDPVASFRVLTFLKKVSRLMAVQPKYLPRIEQFGLAVKSSSLYLVTAYIDGHPWPPNVDEDEAKFDLIRKLGHAVEHLHGLGFSHGDLHPENVCIEAATSNLYLLDIPDFCATEDMPKNHSYSPENIDSASPVERDNYAVIKMASELLNIDWNSTSSEFPAILAAIKTEISDPEFGFKDLSRFLRALEDQPANLDSNSIEIICGSAPEAVELLPDNGRLYGKVERNSKKPSQVKVTFTGIGGAWSAFAEKSSRDFIVGLVPRASDRDFIYRNVIDESQFEINCALKIIPGKPQNLKALTDVLQDDEAFIRAIQLLDEDDFDLEEEEVTRQIRAEFERIGRESQGNQPAEVWDGTEVARKALSAVYRSGQQYDAAAVIEILRGEQTDRSRQLGHEQLSTWGIGRELDKSTWQSVFRQLVAKGLLRVKSDSQGILYLSESCRGLLKGEETLELRRDVLPAKSELKIQTTKLWEAILKTETESYPSIEVSGETRVVDDDTVLIPYSSDTDPLEAFAATDEVEAIYLIDGETERSAGRVLLNRSVNNQLAITKLRSAARHIKDGDTLYFRSRQDRASFQKRKRALERIINRESVTSSLIEYFEPDCGNTPIDFNIIPTAEDFARYDRQDEYGHTISLNSQQREAFSKLVRYGPLSLLQGPPGTGKTEFIAAFVHYLVEKQGTQRILLVSQSHEAVNTAVERIRKHCFRLDTSLEVVRFSNREGAVSEGLKDVYSQSLTTEKRELFIAEAEHRARSLADALGLDPDLIGKMVSAELKLFPLIDRYDASKSEQVKTENAQEARILNGICNDLESIIREKLDFEYGVHLSEGADLTEAKESVIAFLCRDFGIRLDEANRIRAVGKIARDMLDALTGQSVNLDEFYARSRQLVAGTCVGIGQWHIGVQDNAYDWVIIDEAARSIASELAIAMQSAKRVLLVGDHKQLPPLYSEGHKRALARRLGINSAGLDLDEAIQSDFARAFTSSYGQEASASLLTQYRMAPPIGKLVSSVFYDGKLLNGNRSIPTLYDDGPAILRSPVTWVDTSALGEKAYHEGSQSIYNRAEADEILDILRELADSREFLAGIRGLSAPGESAIGVICMYAEQKRLIRKKFNQEVWPDGFKESVKIDTVDSYQGKENRVIILSITRSEKAKHPRFLRSPNRINVAISRAMDRLVIVGDKTMWTVERNQNLPLGRVLTHMSQGSDGYSFVTAGQISEVNHVG